MRVALALSFIALAGCATQPLPATPSAPTLTTSAGPLIVVTLRNPAAPGLHGAGSTWRGWDWGGQYRRSATVERAAAELAGDYGLRQVDAWPIRVLDVHCVVYALDDALAQQALLQKLAGDRRVESAQALLEFRTLAADNGQRDLQTSVATMQLDEAHRWAQGKGVRIAVIDTGVDTSHPDLSGRVQAEYDFVARAGDKPHTERHGTAVAGIIGARARTAEGFVGVAPQAELLVLKACWPLAPGSAEAACNSFTLARALAAAVDLDADVLNLSLSGPADPLLTRMVRAAQARGILVVGAVPEDWARDGAAIFPASVAGVIAVRSAEPGRSARSGVPAPGRDILVPVPGGAYEFQSGSSMAAAHITGIAALLRERRPGLSPGDIDRALQAAVAPDAADAPGSINACLALSHLLAEGACRKP